MKRQNIRTLSLVVITLTYLIVGAAVFDYFESSNEEKENGLLNKNITRFKLKYNMNDTEFNILWHRILEKKPYQAGHQWRFIGSLYFCTVVITLIGYGHSTPRTIPGKCFCIIYTLIGIPIALIMFQSVGERLNSLIAFVLGKLKRKLNLKNQDVGLFELITVEFVLTVTITGVASYIFMRNEGWSYFDAIYYCFITLTTIGFGDMVPMQKDNVLSNNFAYACFTILFILTGLITLASSMNLLVLRLATINAEEQVQEKLEAAEARRQAVHLEGDVISPNGRLFVKEEKPEQVETISVCSCACLDYKIWECKRNRKKRRSSHRHSQLQQLQQQHHPQCTSVGSSLGPFVVTGTSGVSLRNRRASSTRNVPPPPPINTNNKSANKNITCYSASSDINYDMATTTSTANKSNATETSLDDDAGGGGFFLKKLTKLKPLKRLIGNNNNNSNHRDSELSPKNNKKTISIINDKTTKSECIESNTKIPRQTNDFNNNAANNKNDGLASKIINSSTTTANANDHQQQQFKQQLSIVRRHTTISSNTHEKKLTNNTLSNDSGYTFNNTNETNTTKCINNRDESPISNANQQQQGDYSSIDYEDDRLFYKRNSI